MNMQCFPLGDYGANCYLLTDDVSKTAAVIDPGVSSDELNDALLGFDLKYILLTHGHFDHIFGCKSLKEIYPQAEICIHSDDEKCLIDNKINLAGDYEATPGVTADKVLKNGDIIKFADTEFFVLSTPGHSLGSVCYVDTKNKLIFSGDTLFCLTVGRTDFAGGNFDDMMASIKKLSEFDDEYSVYPGHNRATTIGFERKRNRYMRKL
ncbi:MAG: MBL fold metallo-hydrolase [Clostridia bacterium]|nr:MBL fold metallo-hydrolase [Clostridia bacterium]